MDENFRESERKAALEERNPEELIRRLVEAETALRQRFADEIDTFTDPVTGFSYLLRDAQEALRKSEWRYSRLLTRMAAIVFELAPDGTVLYVNPALTWSLGYERDELLGKCFWDIFCQGELRDQVKDLNDLFQTGDVTNHELILAAKDDSRVSFEVSSANHYRNDGTLESVVACGINITLRKLAEDALKASEREFRLLAESIPQIVWITLPDGWNIYSNQRWMDYTGQTLEESYGHGCNKFFHPDDQQRAWDVWQNATKNGTTYDLECRLRRADGVYRWWLIRGAPVFDERGTLLKWFGTCTDIDDLKRAEAERVRLEAQTRQLQKAESLGRMAGAIAHNFNNMLGAAIGNLEMALYDVPQGSELQTCLSEAMKASRRAAEISRLMLTYLGQTTGKSEPIDPAEAAREACALLNTSIPANVHLKTDFPPLCPIIQADGVHLKQVLSNLILNAVEAIGEREGEISLTIKVVTGSEVQKSRFFPLEWEPKAKAYVCLSVADTGCGMDAGTLDKIFDPFFSTKFVGRGLGLPVVLGLVRALDGAITVESHPGRGATFKMFFPAIEQEIVIPPGDEALLTRSVAGSGLVLVVDDEPMVRNVAKSMLKRGLGYEVLTAGDGYEAVEIFRARKDEISLVLLDLSMPGINGWETLARLRALRPDIPVVLASGYDEAQVMQGDHPDLPQAFIHKPYAVANLKAAVAAIQKA